jgi:diguanylate cyclase (GGDEF)-like protein
MGLLQLRNRRAGSSKPFGWWWRGGSAAGYGRVLVVGALLASALALLVLRPALVHPVELALAGAAAPATVWWSFALPWRRWPAWARLAFPATAMSVLVLASHAAPQGSGVFSGFFALCFAYAGIFLPRGGSWVLLAVALPAYLGTSPTIDAHLVVRLALLAPAWVLLGELLGHLQRAHACVVDQLLADNLTDPLTGLANRRGMERFLAEALPGDVVIVFDLDNFKQLNDEHGHAAGDHVLRTFGRLLLGQLRTRDRAARSGGEEMVVLLRCGQDRCGQQLTGRLRGVLATALPGVTFSAGLAVVDRTGTAHEALQAADRAMYRAKRAGRDQVWLAGEAERGEPDVPMHRTAPAVPEELADALTTMAAFTALNR